MAARRSCAVGTRGSSWRPVLLALVAFAVVGVAAWAQLRPRAAPSRPSARPGQAWAPSARADAGAALGVAVESAADNSARIHGRGASDSNTLPLRLSATQQRTVMQAFAPRVRQCLDARFFGQLAVTLAARGDGTVRAARVGAALHGTGAGRCVEQVLGSVTVPRFAAREMEIGWVYVFAAQSQ